MKSETKIYVDTQECWIAGHDNVPRCIPAKGAAIFIETAAFEGRAVVPTVLKGKFDAEKFVGVIFLNHNASNSPIPSFKTLVYVPLADCTELALNN